MLSLSTSLLNLLCKNRRAGDNLSSMDGFNIKISTSIHSDDYEDTLEASYPCEYYFGENVCRIKYTDSEAGFTVVKVCADKSEITMRRQSSFPISLKPGFTCEVSYNSPYGTIPMEITAKSITLALSENGGRLEYKADFLIGGAYQVNNTVIEISSDNS